MSNIGTAALIIEALIVTIFIGGALWVMSPLIFGLESLTPDASIDIGSPEYVSIPEYTKYFVVAPAFLIVITIISSILYIVNHTGGDNVQ